jgi:2-oxo-4-hydroxy-4-carboxy-5-ureidoimidazoline decarboxylase
VSDSLSLDALNALDRNAFVARLSNIFEHSPWIAAAVYDRRPFVSAAALHGAMVEAVRQAGHERQRVLILAHPELGTAKVVTDYSKQEQDSLGLSASEQAERVRLGDLNKKYRDRFGFPFIIAVKGRSRAEVMDEMEKRLSNTPETEFETALNQIGQISRFRLEAMLAS